MRVFSSAEQMGLWRNVSLNDPRRRKITTCMKLLVDGREMVKVTLLSVYTEKVK